jgi:hypothetical protein
MVTVHRTSGFQLALTSVPCTILTIMALFRPNAFHWFVHLLLVSTFANQQQQVFPRHLYVTYNATLHHKPYNCRYKTHSYVITLYT